MRLHGKVALITGAASGIGRTTAELFAREGAAVGVADIDAARAEAAAAAIRSQGFRAEALVGAVDQAAGAEQIVAGALAAFERIDVLFNCAGIGSTGTILDLPEDEWDRVMSVNVKGTFLVSRYAARAMIEAGGGGSIINMGSLAGVVGGPRMAAYNASKGAVVLLSKNMAIDLAPHRIRVNCLCPGTTLTPLVQKLLDDRQAKNMFLEDMLNPARAPLGRFAEVEEVSRACLFLASDDASYVTGSILNVDGGFSAW